MQEWIVCLTVIESQMINIFDFDNTNITDTVDSSCSIKPLI